MRTCIWLAFLVACSTGSTTVTSTRYDVDVAFEPDPPEAGFVTARMMVTEPDGEPVTGCAMDCSAMMPEHNHGGMMEPVVTEMGDGEYEMEWDCPMAGHWEIAVDMDCPGGEDHVVIHAQVD